MLILAYSGCDTSDAGVDTSQPTVPAEMAGGVDSGKAPRIDGLLEAGLRACQAFGSDYGRHVSVIGRLSPYAAANYLCRGGGYDKYLMRMASGNKLYENELMSRREQVLQHFVRFRSARDFLESMEIKPDGGDHPDSRVGLYTFHGSKGLEFDHVYIVGATEREYDDLEEERRMFYVAVTRAKSHLTLITHSKSSGKKKYPSRFLAELQSPATG